MFFTLFKSADDGICRTWARIQGLDPFTTHFRPFSFLFFFFLPGDVWIGWITPCGRTKVARVASDGSFRTGVDGGMVTVVPGRVFETSHVPKTLSPTCIDGHRDGANGGPGWRVWVKEREEKPNPHHP